MSDPIRERKLVVLFHQTPMILIATLLAGVLLSVSLYDTVPRIKIAAFLLALGVVFLIRALVVLGFQHRDPERSFVGWEGIYLATLGGSALTWGLGGLWLADGAANDVKLLVYVYLVGIGIGGVATYAAMRVSVLIASVCLLGPMTFSLLLEPHAPLRFAGIAGLLLILATLRSSKVVSDTFDAAYRASAELEREKQLAETHARTDQLTGLHNRRAYTELAEKALARGRRNQSPCAVAVIDIDHFKGVNDTRGHSAGDACLVAVAKALEGCVRRGDICGRFGGEEFVVFLPDTDWEGAAVVAEKLRSVIAGTIIEGAGPSFSVTASLGYAVGLQEFEELFRLADVAMYKAKTAGRDCVVSAEHRTAETAPARESSRAG